MPWVNTDDHPDFYLSKEDDAMIERQLPARTPKMRFYVDADVPPLAVKVLRERKYNVRTVQEERRKKGHPDENHIAVAWKEKRYLLTCDHHFLNDTKFPLNQCPVIIKCDFGTGTRQEINDTLNCLLTLEWAPHLFSRWVKIDANPSCWIEKMRYQEGYIDRYRHRLHKGKRQVWVDDHDR